MKRKQRKGRKRMGLLIAAAVLIVGYGGAYVASEDVRYVTRAGFEETRILAGRVPIQVVASDSSYPEDLRQAAGLVNEARRYAAVMGLDAGETFTTFSDVGRDTLLLVLTASPRNCICPVTWRYPIVGRVAYRGFFDAEHAQREAERYLAMDYDVHLRPAPAFSTLGWFNDPLLSTAVTTDSVELAAMVFHEIAHNSLWVKNAPDFNESFAQWVGYRMSESFFRSRGNHLLAVRAIDRWSDEQLLGRYYERFMNRLDSVYASDPLNIDAAREAVDSWRSDTLPMLLGGEFRTINVEGLKARRINNAALVGVRMYRTNLELFAAWEEVAGGQIDLAVYSLIEALGKDVDGSQVWGRLRALAEPGLLPPEVEAVMPVPE
jgi:predicted aminopeptidase